MPGFIIRVRTNPFEVEYLNPKNDNTRVFPTERREPIRVCPVCGVICEVGGRKYNCKCQGISDEP